jgi:hypothetical protein
MSLRATLHRLPLSLLIAALIVAGCGGGQKQSETASTPAPAADSSATMPPPPLPATAVMAVTWFDKDQGANVAANWAKARDAMAALGGHRFSAVFTTMDWERQSNLMALSLWDDAASAGNGLRVAEAQLPARGWAKSGVYRRIGADGDMRDTTLRTVVMVFPITSLFDSATATTDFNTINEFMRQQPGYIASILFERVSGNPAYGHLIAARWATLDDLKRVGGLPGFTNLKKQVALTGDAPTTYLQLNY